MTGASARALKLADRGLLREGYRADIAIFDPADFHDRATYADPHRYPSGSRTTVLVNGIVVVEDCTHTGALPGNVLRRDRSGRGVAVSSRTAASGAAYWAASVRHGPPWPLPVDAPAVSLIGILVPP